MVKTGMMNKKHTLIITVSLIGGLVLAACGAGTAPESEAAPAKNLEPAQGETPTEIAPTNTAETAATDTSTEAIPSEPTAAAPEESPASVVSFANDVFPIIKSRCYNCHGGQRVEKGLLLGSYDELLAGSDNGPVIVPGNAADSLLVELVASQKMPKRGPKLTPPQVQLITEWVNSGAPNN